MSKNSKLTGSPAQARLGLNVYIGFGGVLLLSVLAMLALHQLRLVNDEIVRVVEVNNVKIKAAISMQEAINVRIITLYTIISTDDYFERDDLLQLFYNAAGQYRISRDILVALSNNAEEKEIHERLTQQTKFAQPLVRETVERIMNDESDLYGPIRSAIG